MLFHLQLARLIATRICHDLVGPVGGMNNGVEFLSETLADQKNGAAEFVSQSLALLQLSAAEGSAKLQVFRQAFGIINQVDGRSDIDAVEALLKDYFAKGTIALVWQRHGVKAVPHATRQLLINAVLVVATTLVTGGTITITFTKGDETRLTISGEGSTVKVEDALLRIFSNQAALEEITPHTVHFYFTHCLAEELTASITPKSGERGFALDIILAA